jgi:Domain of unknown function (DUF6285)
MGSEFFGSPTAAQLTEAVREFLESLTGDIAPERAFHLRVAVNALRVVERELLAGADAADGHQGRMASLGVPGERDLARSIRAGQFPLARREEILASVLADVEARLQANSPDYVARYEADQ